MPTAANIANGGRIVLICATVALCLLVHSTSQANELSFRETCHQGKRTLIAAVGDLIFQRPIQDQIDKGARNYRCLWQRLEPVFASADVVYGNLEGPVSKRAGNSKAGVLGREGYPLAFSYAPSLLDNLAGSGFDVVSTANNHALDLGSTGVDSTIEELKARGLAFTGTRKSDDALSPWSAITTDGGMRIAWLACTYGTNGRPDRKAQVLHCDKQRAEVVSEIRSLAEDATVDAVVLAPHWGVEDTSVVEPGQESLARQAISNGATVVLGAHPHVLQRWEKFPLPSGGEGLVIFSLGNFVSAQPLIEQRTGAVALIELVKPKGAMKASVANAYYIVTHIAPAPSFAVAESSDLSTPKSLPKGKRKNIEEAIAFNKTGCLARSNTP
ncbi:MAG: CapA family protein [Filomicrobium sp.]